MVIQHIEMVILEIDMGYGLMVWEMTVSIWSSCASIWDILSLWWQPHLVRQRIQGIKDVLQRQQRGAGGRGDVVEEQVDATRPQHPPHLPPGSYTRPIFSST
jgi:hypothetical protein